MGRLAIVGSEGSGEPFSRVRPASPYGRNGLSVVLTSVGARARTPGASVKSWGPVWTTQIYSSFRSFGAMRIEVVSEGVEVCVNW